MPAMLDIQDYDFVDLASKEKDFLSTGKLS